MNDDLEKAIKEACALYILIMILPIILGLSILIIYGLSLLF